MKNCYLDMLAKDSRYMIEREKHCMLCKIYIFTINFFLLETIYEFLQYEFLLCDLINFKKSIITRTILCNIRQMFTIC